MKEIAEAKNSVWMRRGQKIAFHLSSLLARLRRLLLTDVETGILETSLIMSKKEVELVRGSDVEGRWDVTFYCFSFSPHQSRDVKPAGRLELVEPG